MKHIHDHIHGYITVSEDELDIIGTPEVQRLRYVSQLGLSSAVYPGATHSRFAHSLGVMHLAGRFCESLGLSDEETATYRLAGLLHDLGHAPFSHATERIMEERMGISHEEQSCRRIQSLAESHPDAFTPDPDFVCDAIKGDTELDIVAGSVDADRMDYLQRDAAATGIPHGEIDSETIIQFAEQQDGGIIFSHKSIRAIKDLLNAREAMTESVYEHHTSSIVERMLEQAVEHYLNSTDTSAEELLSWDDRQLHTKLLEFENNSNQGLPDIESPSNGIYTQIANRTLYKRALIITGTSEDNRETLQRLYETFDDTETKVAEREISQAAGVHKHKVLIDPPSTLNNADPEIPILWGDDIRSLSSLNNKDGLGIDPSSYQSFGVYCPKEDMDSVEAAAREYLNIPEDD